MEQKERIVIAGYVVDELTMRLSAIMGNKDAEIRSAWDYFPGLFEDEKEAAEERRKEIELQKYLDSRYNFAAAHNKAFRERKEREKNASECPNTADAAGSDPG